MSCEALAPGGAEGLEECPYRSCRQKQLLQKGGQIVHKLDSEPINKYSLIIFF